MCLFEPFKLVALVLLGSCLKYTGPSVEKTLLKPNLDLLTCDLDFLGCDISEAMTTGSTCTLVGAFVIFCHLDLHCWRQLIYTHLSSAQSPSP